MALTDVDTFAAALRTNAVVNAIDTKCDGQPWEVVFPSDSPLLTTTYESSDGLFDALKEFCIENRMGLITLRSQKDKAKTRTIKYELVCDKSQYNPRESTAKIRNTTTTKLAANCPFKIIAQSLQTNNYEWSMRIVSPLHRDHGRSKNLTEHYHWRRLTEEQMNLLVDLCLDKTISCRSVHKQLCQKWPKFPIRRTDIYNWRWKVNQTKRQGYGPANDFVRTLSESKKVWIWGLDWIGDEFRFRNAAWGYHKVPTAIKCLWLLLWPYPQRRHLCLSARLETTTSTPLLDQVEWMYDLLGNYIVDVTHIRPEWNGCTRGFISGFL
ncbi:transposase [Ilyonectria robusta]